MTSPWPKIAADWIRHRGASNPQGPKPIPESERWELENASMDLMAAVDDGGDEAFGIIEEILRQTNDEWVLACLGAGPFEDLLGRGPPDAPQRLATLAMTYPGAQAALANVWTDERLSPQGVALVEHYLQRLYPPDETP